MNIYTLGYQGLNPETYIQALINAGVNILVDVRENSWSQRPAYVGSTLRQSLPPGISYQHWKALGNPAQNRKTAKSAGECMAKYRDYLRQQQAVLDLFLEEVRRAAVIGNRICLTCYEKEHINCHRSVIIEELIEIEPTLMPIHLEPTPQPKTPVLSRASSSQVSLSFP